VNVPPYFEKEMAAVVHNENIDRTQNPSLDDRLTISTCNVENPVEEESLSEEMIQIEKSIVRRLDYIYVMPCFCILIMIQVVVNNELIYSEKKTDLLFNSILIKRRSTIPPCWVSKRTLIYKMENLGGWVQFFS
jgi:hypothetical protein